MSIADDGREPDPPHRRGGTNRRPADGSDEVTRRGAAGRRLVAMVVGVVLLVVLVVWLVLFLTARETSDESMGAARAQQPQPTLSVVQ